MFLRFSVRRHMVCKGSVFGPRTGNLNPTSSMLLILFSMMGPLWSSISNGTPKAVKGVSISLQVQEASVACLSSVHAACLPRDQDALLSHFVMRALLPGGTPSHSSTVADTVGGGRSVRQCPLLLSACFAKHAGTSPEYDYSIWLKRSPGLQADLHYEISPF